MKKVTIPEVCEIKDIHYDRVRQAKSNLLDDDNIADLSDFFKIFSDGTRLKILMLLVDNELCVCDIMEALKLKQSTVSQQLRLLRQMRLVKHYQSGKQVFYSLNDDHIYKILTMGIEHLQEKNNE